MAAPPAPITPAQAPLASTLIAPAAQVPTLAVAQQSVPQRPAAQPPSATLSGEEEVEVEDKLKEEAAGSLAQKGCKGKGLAHPAAQVMQPMWQSTRLQKPSALIRRIEMGEGTAREELSGYVKDNEDLSEWANLVGYEELIATTIQEVEGDLKSVQEV